ncbi:MAG: PmoA family protein [Planctomycetia bacterium]|nr:PmoA family protein [Planctomycetia bacterium]
MSKPGNKVIRTKRKIICYRVFTTVITPVILLFCMATQEVFSQQKETFHWETIDDDTLALYDGDLPLWHYVYRQRVHDWVDQNDARRVSGCYFNPVFGLNGEVLTTGATVWDNHQHHHGLWPSFSVVKIIESDGRVKTYDLWTDNTGLKRQFVQFGPRSLQKEKAVFAVENGWFVNGSESVVKEVIEVTTYPIANNGEYGRFRVFDFAFSWQATDKRVRLETAGRSFSSMVLRFAPPADKPRIQSVHGEISRDEMQIDIPWLDYQSQFSTSMPKSFDRKPEPASNLSFQGIAIFPSVNNPQFQGGWAIRHYGMVCTGWPGTDGAELIPGKEPIKITYRIVVHDQPWSVATVTKLYEEYGSDAAGNRKCSDTAMKSLVK